MDLFNDVGRFHKKFDLPVYDPTQPTGMQLTRMSRETAEYRKKFMQEELDEFWTAFEGQDDAKMLDALVDLVYVATGTAHLMRAPFNEAWKEVHRANMTKERAKSADDPRSTRKNHLDVVKPEGFVPPDIQAVLEGRTTYDRIAAEYYEARHMTCRNFDMATKHALDFIRLFLRAPIIEIGAGKGRCLEFTGKPADVQVDSSMEMLKLQPRELAHRVCADARQLPFPDKSFRTLVAFLCDPFLDVDFLREAYRITSESILLTTPSDHWAVALRGGEKHMTTFLTNDGQSVHVPSNVWQPSKLLNVLIDVGFREPEITFHGLPPYVQLSDVSGAIIKAADNVKSDPMKMPIVNVIRAKV